MENKIFTKPVSAPRMLLLVTLAVILLLADHYTAVFAPARAWLETAARPLSRLGNLPGQMVEWSRTNVAGPGGLAVKNRQLQAELLVLKGQLQQLAELGAENVRLRTLLNAHQTPKLRLLMAELIGVSPDPRRHQITIDRGEHDGVFIGQAVLDSGGLMGQVVQVSAERAEVLLVSDERHAVPVRVAGTDMRAIAEGTGDYRRLRLRHVQPTLEIAVNDLLLTSGLGGHFPAGYPVGRVASIELQPGQPFVEVTVTPAAELDRSRHLLLVFPEPASGAPHGG
ncbi:MAG: rod shape-determining protein MreC [Porticoccaceae bacterium]